MINEKSYADIIGNISNEDFEKLAKSKEYETAYDEYLDGNKKPNQKERESARQYAIEKSYSAIMESWYIEDGIKDKNVRLIDEDDLYRQVGYQKFGEKWVGSFNHKDTKRVNDYYLLMIDSWDKALIKNIRLKDEEYILRYETETTKIGGMRPLVKVNVVKGLVYFLEDYESDKVEFSKKSSKITYMNLREEYFKDVKFLKENITINEGIELKNDEILIAKNEARYSWEYFSQSKTLYIILNTDTKKLRVAVEEYTNNSEPPVYKDTKVIDVKSDVGTITKPKFAEINKIKKQYNFDRSRASSPMKPNSWEVYVSGKVASWDMKLNDVFTHPEMLQSLKITLFEEIEFNDKNKRNNAMKILNKNLKESVSIWEEMKELIKEGKKIKVKRKYTESYPAKFVGGDAKIRNEIIKYLGSNQLMSEDEFEDLLLKSSKHPKLWKKNNPDIYEKCKDGYIRLTKKGKKILDGLTVNEDLNEKEDFDEKDERRILDLVDKAKNKSHEEQLAQTMANRITDANKALRRARAAEDQNYHNIAKIFFDRYESLDKTGMKKKIKLFDSFKHLYNF